MAVSTATANVPRGINIANSLRPHFVFPCAGFIPFPETGGYAEHSSSDSHSYVAVPESSSRWVIEFSGFGILYSAIPTFLAPLTPNRIDVVIPDQVQWPPSLWDKLNARDSVHVSGTRRINSLGIAAHLREGLQHWSDRVDNKFGEWYRSLPFGSTLHLDHLPEDPAAMSFRIVHNQAPAEPGLFLSADDLRSMWGLAEPDMPSIIPYTKLRHLRQLSSDVILVSVPGEEQEDGDIAMVFKSSKSRPYRIYHEIKVLLSIPSSETIIDKPKYLVTLPSNNLVCGFLLTFYEGGNLADVLPERRLSNILTLRQQVSWAIDLTKSLIHIKRSPARFYSDLRLDQLVLSKNADGSERAVLFDLEQSRNVYNWAPPEIYYVEWLAELGSSDYARTDDLPVDVLSKYGAILDRYLKSRGQPIPLVDPGKYYDNPPHGKYWPWLTSSPSEQEAGMVYMLGKAIWCLFEGVGDADIILGRSSIYDGQQRFPEFVRTPPELRELIKTSTSGAREWIDGPIQIYRRQGKIFPLGKTGLHGEPEGTFEETKEAIGAFWRNEMCKAEQFVEARIRYDANDAREEDLGLLHYLRRPTLDQVLFSLEQYCQSVL